MNEENNVQAENSTQQEEEVLETSHEETNYEQETSENTEELKARLEKAEELAKNYKIRAEKAEKANKTKVEVASKPQSNGDLSSKDLYALMEAKVAQDDIDEVIEYANLKKISVSEALKSNVVKSILSDKAEQRRTANATNVSANRRSSGKVSDEALVENFKKGIAPESDEDIMRLVQARTKK